jgi:glycerophosphoryl diester phosphodiesterase
MSPRPPLIVHHMAAPHDAYPPNSLEAIRACLEADAPFIEIDITALAHGDYLLVHDPDLESETTGSGKVAEASPESVAGLTYRAHDGTPTTCAVGRLSQAVALYLEHGGETRLQLDFKNVIPFPDDEPLRRLVNLIAPLGDRVIVSSGADWQLRRLRRLAPWLDLGLDVHFYIDWRRADDTIDPRIPPYRQGAYGYWDDHPLATARFYSMQEYLWDRCASLAALVPGCSTFYIDYKMVLQSLDDGFSWADACHELGIRLDIWTLDLHDEARTQAALRLLRAGVDQITTNTPAALSALVAAAQQRHP